jgi:oxygen-dependent protoporphyrinogen oxidase
MPSNKSVIVVGAGLSGLACAYKLKQRGLEVMLLDAGRKPGGLIGSVTTDGFVFESGPQSFQLTDTLAALVRELKLESALQTADSKAPRYVLKHGQLEQIPMSPQAMLTSQFLSLGSRFKIASEPFRRSKPPVEEESVAAFVRRKFGHEILEYLVSPFVSGVYAGDPEKLSLKAAFPTLDEWERQYGSVIRGAKKSRAAAASGVEQAASRPSLCSFTTGVSALPRALAANLGERFGANVKATAVEAADSGFALHASHGDSATVLNASAVVFATPSYAALDIVRPFSPKLATILGAIAYAPVAVVAAGYRRMQVSDALIGFGFLVPRAEKIRTLGTIYNSSLFSGRAPENSVTLTSFIGGATDLEIAQLAESEIANIAHRDNAKILQISGSPMVTQVWKWNRALPQYNLGHGHIVESLRTVLRETPGVFLAGNYLEGPAVGKCVETGYKTADEVESYLSRSAS